MIGDCIRHRIALTLLTSFGCAHERPAASALRPAHVVDLSHVLSPRFPFIPVETKTFPFRMTPIATLDRDGVYANRWSLTEHVGTHLDAPAHFAPGGTTIDRIPIAALVVPAVIISIVDRVVRDPDAALTAADVRAWETIHGAIPVGAAVLAHTGWDRLASDAARFVAMDRDGTMHFPASPWTRSTSCSTSGTSRASGSTHCPSIPVARGNTLSTGASSRRGKWAIECMKNLAALPPVGATVVVGAVDVEGASGAPARVIAFW